MRIGISINGVVRDYLGKLERTFEKYFPDDEPVTATTYNLDEWLIIPESDDTTKEVEFNPDSDEVQIVEQEVINLTPQQFVYEEHALEIFGHATESEPGIIDLLNQIAVDQKISLVSREVGKSIPATLFFLSKFSCMVQDIRFYNTYEEHWDDFDVLITDNPDILISKPENKISVKLKKSYNENIYSDHTIDSPKELNTLNLKFT